MFEPLQKEQANIVSDMEKILTRMKKNGGEISIYVSEKEREYYDKLSETLVEMSTHNFRVQWMFFVYGFIFGTISSFIILSYI